MGLGSLKIADDRSGTDVLADAMATAVAFLLPLKEVTTMNHPNRVRLSKLSLGLMIALAAAPVFAQSTSAGVGGIVTGADGKPVVGAQVTITHTESGTVSRAITDASGRYSARGLRVGGPYTIVVAKEGAGIDTEEGVYLNLNQISAVNAQLNNDTATLGSVVVIGDGAPDVFNSDNKGLSTTVTGRQLEVTPQGNRSVDDIARLDPRIQVTDQGDGSISANGLPNRYNEISVDGLSQGDPFGLNANGMPVLTSPISVDTIAEYNISTTEFDTTSDAVGAKINAVTKSGTNDFHGSVYTAYRNANSMVGKVDGRKYRGYDEDKTYGFTVGGPIIKDKLFFFASAEQETVSGIGSSEVNGLDTGLISQQDLDRVISTAQSLGLKPGGLGGNAFELKEKRYLAKIDWNISDYQRLSLTHQRTDEVWPKPRGGGFNWIGLDSSWYTQQVASQNTSLQFFSDWSDRFSTEAKVSYQNFEQLAGNAVNQPNVRVYLGNSNRAPYVVLGEDEFRHENEIRTKKLSAYLAGTFYAGDHVIKGGLDYQSNEIYNLFGRTQHGVYQFFGLDNFAAGKYASYRLNQPAPGYSLEDVAAQWTYSQLSLFLQDTWQASDNLSLLYGVRVNIPKADRAPPYNAAFEESFGIRNDYKLGSSNKVIEPRFGFNYSFDTERRTQLRGGIGLFQTVPPTVWMTNPYQNNGLTLASYSSFNPDATPFSADPYNQNLPSGAGSVSGVVDTLDPNFKLPTVWKAALAFDRELPWWGMVGSVEWQLVKSKDAIFYTAPNIGKPTRDANGNVVLLPDGRFQFWCSPGGTSFSQSNCYRDRDFDRFSTVLRNTGKGKTNSLTLGLSKPFGHGWSANISTTVTHATEVNPGNSSQASSGYRFVVRTNPNEELAATADRAIRQSIKASLTWEHAFFGDYKTTLSSFYNGRSGLPYSWIFSGDVNGDGISFQDPVYIPLVNDPIVSYGSATPAQIAAFHQFISRDTYLQAHRGQIAGRNAARMPWVNQFDVGIQQELPGFFKDHKTVMRLDIYNALNLVNNNWGQVEYLGFNTRTLAGYRGVTADGKYNYDISRLPQGYTLYQAGENSTTRTVSLWSAMLTLRYNF